MFTQTSQMAKESYLLKRYLLWPLTGLLNILNTPKNNFYVAKKSYLLVSSIDSYKHIKSTFLRRTFHTTLVYAKSAKILLY